MSCPHRWAAVSEGWKRCVRCLATTTTEGDDLAAIVAQWNRKLQAEGQSPIRTKQVFKSKRRQWTEQQQRKRRRK